MFRCLIPECAEVKLSTEKIRSLVLNHIVYAVDVGKNSRYKEIPPEGFVEFKKSLIFDSNKEDKTFEDTYVQITNIKNKGKFMWFEFSNGWFMMNTFGMTGQWSPHQLDHPCFTFITVPSPIHSSLHELTFHDPRHFGTIKFVNNFQPIADKLKKIGWDPLQNNLDDYIGSMNVKIQKSDKFIGEMLLDQSLFGGVGNYLRAEALYLAKISPWRQGFLMSKEDIKNLCLAIKNVTSESYQHQGATISTYKNVDGSNGKHADFFKVYRKNKDPLGNKVSFDSLPEGRTIYYVPNIQV